MRNLCFSLKQLRKIGPADVEARSEFVRCCINKGVSCNRSIVQLS